MTPPHHRPAVTKYTPSGEVRCAGGSVLWCGLGQRAGISPEPRGRPIRGVDSMEVQHWDFALCRSTCGPWESTAQSRHPEQDSLPRRHWSGNLTTLAGCPELR